MLSVSGTNNNPKIFQNPAPAVRSFRRNKPSSSGKSSAPVRDRVQLTTPSNVSLSDRVSQLLERLSEHHPDIQFHTVPDSELNDLKALAASLGHGSHLVLSEGFLARMSQSEEDFLACRNILISSIFLLSEDKADGAILKQNTAVTWNIQKPQAFPGISSGSEETDAYRTLYELLKSLNKSEDPRFSYMDPKYQINRAAYQTAGLYNRLAQANSKQGVRSVMADAQKNIAALRLTSCLGEPEDRIKARKAIRSLQKLLLRGNQKNRRLDQETLLKIRKRRAKERLEERKMRQLQLELKKKRTTRKSIDQAIRFEGEQEEREIRRVKYYLASLGDSYTPFAGMGGTGSAGGPSGGSAASPVTAESISLSAFVSF